MRLYLAVTAWQSWSVLKRHLTVYLRNWHTAALPPILEPVILLLVFGVGLGSSIPDFDWKGRNVSYLSYLAPGILAYTAFMTAFFQALFAAYIRMHYQKTWEGQLTTQVRLEHVVWGEALWAAALGLAYCVIVFFVIAAFTLSGWLALHWQGLAIILPLLFLTGVAFAALGLLFTAIVPTIDHMNIPFYLIIMPLGFASNTYFPLESDNLLAQAWLLINPLHHTAEGIRLLLLSNQLSYHLPAAVVLFGLMILILLPVDLRLLRRRVLGEA
ncbi:MAG: ABC transporter permease [Candidatus Thiodiazotropha sp. (ex Ctena orbiculata)]|uniref:Transport permease protein n=1 Tax=Candidatus Thiodiazotropha taylori TaxID=2792791 RepID=A0A944M7A2_9GAMM|nr:ABC transporter permease [Candidatus Thiodiazotropha taylori]MBT2988420.1 ABC transporter permease [Candidatus Thiodiazotropha taylori]MBT2997327.1 ABC transporter permease [Candidatus Thiodiazotropha taylori]MBT3000963.1 ABC transporter permease [Candidatus Thiodiazotropha taylori]MBT3027782.1 ABC transporter permease [Candidatus Thiodiazotropha taylori]